LPVTVCDAYTFGSGIKTAALYASPALNSIASKFHSIDSIANDAISKGATPGCVVLVVKDGKIAFTNHMAITTMIAPTP
jgi:hypothetical protein